MSGSGPAPLVSVVIVAWESEPELAECVRSLASARARIPASAPPVELVVVDNGSREFDEAGLSRDWPGVRVIRNRANRGFGPAANQGAAAAAGEIVLFLNPDAQAVGDPFTPLVEAFRARPDAVAVAPRLLQSTEGTSEAQELFQLRHLPTWRQAIRELLLIDKALPRSRGLMRERYGERDRDRSFEVEQPAAAALAVRREVFVRIGGFDEGFLPAWFEDVDLCARLLELGRIVYWPDSRFAHDGGVSARRLGYDRFLPIYYRNATRYWRKHHGPAAALAYRALVTLGMALRLLVLPLRRGLPRPRPEAARAYLRVLRWAAALGFHLPEGGR